MTDVPSLAVNGPVDRVSSPDLLLQQHGYMIIRFLADDIGKNLDLVLDTILRCLAHRAATSQE